MNALDTNVWIYSHDTRETEKQQMAQRLIAEARPGVLLWQVGCEFIAASSLKKEESVMNIPKWPINRIGKFMILPGMAAFLAWTLPSAADSPASHAAAKKEIQKVLEAQATAWNKGDLKGFMAGYWKSDDLSFFSGKEKTRGWPATFERYQKRYQAEGREMGKVTFSEIEIEMLGPEAAWVRGRWKVVTSKETLGGLFTLIFKKLPEGWRIVHDHTSS